MVNRELWIKMFKLRLGGDILSIEVSDDTINTFIDIAFSRAKYYATDYEYMTVPCSQAIQLPDYVLSVSKIYPVNYQQSDTIDVQNLFDFQLNYNTAIDRVEFTQKSVELDFYVPFRYEHATHTLYVSDKYRQPKITIKYIKDKSLEELRDPRAISWVERYAFALTKEAIGRIRSKAKSSNVPIELDGDTLLSEAQSEMGTLDEELKNEGFGTTFALR